MEVVHLCVCTKRCWRCCALRLPLDPPPKKKNIIKMIVWSRRSSRDVCGNSKWTEAQSAIRCINTRSPTDIKSTQATSSKEATAPNKKKNNQPTNSKMKYVSFIHWIIINFVLVWNQKWRIQIAEYCKPQTNKLWLKIKFFHWKVQSD